MTASGGPREDCQTKTVGVDGVQTKPEDSARTGLMTANARRRVVSWPERSVSAILRARRGGAYPKPVGWPTSTSTECARTGHGGGGVRLYAILAPPPAATSRRRRVTTLRRFCSAGGSGDGARIVVDRVDRNRSVRNPAPRKTELLERLERFIFFYRNMDLAEIIRVVNL